MIALVSFAIVLNLVAANPEYGWDYGPSILKAQSIIPAPIIKSVPAPVFAPTPILDHGPVLAPAPILDHGPVLAHAPIIKAIAPATSYASVTQYHVTHSVPIVKTIAQPIIKSYIPAPLDYGHGY